MLVLVCKFGYLDFGFPRWSVDLFAWNTRCPHEAVPHIYPPSPAQLEYFSSFSLRPIYACNLLFSFTQSVSQNCFLFIIWGNMSICCPQTHWHKIVLFQSQPWNSPPELAQDIKSLLVATPILFGGVGGWSWEKMDMINRGGGGHYPKRTRFWYMR